MDKLPPLPPRDFDNEAEILDAAFGTRVGLILFLVLTLAALVLSAAITAEPPITRELPIPPRAR
jgi:hypothetical protein